MVNASPPDPKENERGNYGAGYPAHLLDVQHATDHQRLVKTVYDFFRVPSHLLGLKTRTSTGSVEAFRKTGNAQPVSHTGEGGSKT